MKPGQGHYDHQEVEAKWQRIWEEKKINQMDLARIKKPLGSVGGKPFYNLMMFPYPSAEGLHIGNMYAFTGSDIYGRFKRMQGDNVFEPIGLDGFGIHSENYALKIGKHPMEQAQISKKNFYRQLRQIGGMFDWTRTVETYDPEYYCWTQWLFVQMFKHGLAYRGKAEVNWCPSCKTVLADEQVIDARLPAPGSAATGGQGRCERCGNIVEKRLLEQWFFRITAYAGKLLENLVGSARSGVNLDWSAKVKIAQENWIGRKEGINITYPVMDAADKKVGEVVCFTTRPDTNFGATFVVLSPEHPFVNQVLKVIDKERLVRIRKYVEAAQKKSKEERIAEARKKTGVATGLYCFNQLNGHRMPLFVSDFVVMDVGTGAVVGVPGHDKRDFEFAQVFKLPVARVVKGKDDDTSPITKISQVQEEAGTMINSEFLNGLDIHEATQKMMDYLEKQGWGERVVTYHLRDWLISRQRYWGPPIPMIYCSTCASKGKSWFTTDEAKDVVTELRIQNSMTKKLSSGIWDLSSPASMAGWYPVPETQLPVELPYIKDYKPGDDGIAPLAKHKEFYEVECPGCGGKAIRETDVSDTFLDSSWYFLRYPSVGSSTSKHAPFDPEITKKWLPVTMYTGGAEHSVLHLMYSRFITMALHDWGYLDFEEPFTRFYAHGLVIKDGAKMSKSKGNVVTPDEYIASYGADALRLYLMFMGPFDQGGDFRDTAMEGMSRWVGRVWQLGVKSEKLKVKSESQEIRKALHRLIRKVTEDTEKRRYNTAIAAMMEFTNLVADEGKGIGVAEAKIFVKLLAPYAPHLAEELWHRLRYTSEDAEVSASWRIPASWTSVHDESWPQFDPAALVEDTLEIIVQVNGKLRDTIEVKSEKCKVKSDVEAAARSSAKVAKHLERKTVKKVIFVPGKLLNFVVS